MIKAIFWDNDGVLVETEHLYFQATQQVLASVGIRLTREEYIELFLVQGRGAWHRAEEHGIAPDRIEQLRNERNALYSDRNLIRTYPASAVGKIKVNGILNGRAFALGTPCPMFEGLSHSKNCRVLSG